MSFDVVVVGELNADLILSGAVTPAFGQAEKIVDDANLVVGSSAGIFACGAAKLGLKVALIGKVGQDQFGQFLMRELDVCGVNLDGLVLDPHLKTGLSVILVRGVDRAILTYLGAISTLEYAEINTTIIERARHIHLCSYYLLHALRPHVPRLFDFAHAHGLTVSLDTNYDPIESWDSNIEHTLARTDVFLPNETELLGIAGAEDTTAALSTLAARVPVIAVKQGVRGAMARRGEESAQGAALSVDVVDTVGAGDSFDAGFIYGYLQGWTLERTVKFASACGSLSTRGAGGTSAQPSLAEATVDE